MEGLEFDAETKEGKVIKMMADILEDLANEVTDVQDDVADINEYMGKRSLQMVVTGWKVEA